MNREHTLLSANDWAFWGWWAYSKYALTQGLYYYDGAIWAYADGCGARLVL